LSRIVALHSLRSANFQRPSFDAKRVQALSQRCLQKLNELIVRLSSSTQQSIYPGVAETCTNVRLSTLKRLIPAQASDSLANFSGDTGRAHAVGSAHCASKHAASDKAAVKVTCQRTRNSDASVSPRQLWSPDKNHKGVFAEITYVDAALWHEGHTSGRSWIAARAPLAYGQHDHIKQQKKDKSTLATG